MRNVAVWLMMFLLSGGSIMAQDSLKKYRSKRKVTESGEPVGKKQRGHKHPEK